jgi:hypothetical protein
MTDHQRPEFALRHAVIKHLSDDEIARVMSRPSPDLKVGDEFLAMEQLALGVQRASGTSLPPGPLLARSTVEQSTWQRILAFLEQDHAQGDSLYRPR